VQDERYFREQVQPHIDGDRVRYLGSVGPQQRAQVLGAAAALLHPIAFAEPFGLSVVEAMACGTPVIAYPLGSMREVIDVGLTGYLVSDVAAAVAAVDQAAALDRAAIRRVAERRFSAARMVDDYLTLYRRLLAK
jgi:glycosyltransferase involved in cell wall biosynthesis